MAIVCIDAIGVVADVLFVVSKCNKLHNQGEDTSL